MPRSALGALLLLLAPSALAGGLIAFPGPFSEVSSLDGRFVLANVDSDEPPYHVLYLREKAKSGQEKLLEYGRHASALWAPDGRGLVINDYGGSDYSNCLVFAVASARKHVDIRAELRKQLAGERLIFRNHHVYIEGVAWLGADKVKVKVSGYGDIDPKGFTLFYEYSLDGSFRLLSRTASFSGTSSGK
jgi:hypothetical protein